MTIQPTRVLWPTDFSEQSCLGGRYARAFAQAFAAELHVLHVCQPLFAPGVDLPLSAGLNVGVSQKELLDAADSRMKHLVAREFPDWPRLKQDVCVGVPWQEICSYVEAANIDLIVIGTHGYTGLRHALIGSTAERVVQHARCPVLTVKDDGRGFLRNDPQPGVPRG